MQAAENKPRNLELDENGKPIPILRWKRSKNAPDLYEMLHEDDTEKGRVCGKKRDSFEEDENLVFEGDKLEAIEVYMEDAIKKSENAIKNWVKLGLRI